AEHRYQTARELKVDLERVSTRQGTVPAFSRDTQEPIKPQRKIAWKIGIAVLALCLAVVGGLYWPRHPSVAVRMSARQSIAVLGFKNETANKKDDWISSILTTQLPIELAAGEKVRIISDEDVDRAKKDLALTNSGSLARDTLTRINRRLNADLIVV